MSKKDRSDSKVSRVYDLADSTPKSKRKPRSRKEHEQHLNFKHPGSKLKPNKGLSRSYAFKGGSPAKLKELREAVERGELTQEQALLLLRGEAGQQPVVVEEIQVPVPVEPSLEERLQDIRARKALQRVERKNSVITDGFLYLVVNPAFPGWTKVGHTTDYEKRLAGYQTASPYTDYHMVAKKWVKDSLAAEQEFLKSAGLAFTTKGEWIYATVEELLENF